jgi:MFS family permease
MYRAELGVGAATVQAVFAMYVVGLVPGLLLGGPVSDRYGRRPVVLAALAASVAAVEQERRGGHGVAWLFAGRLVAGFASGAGFSAGAAWIRELSAGVGAEHGPRRATVAMTVGFGLGPLVAGVLAQWAPARTVLPYLPHLLLAIAALPLVRRTPETRTPAGDARLRVPDMSSRRFRTVVAPLAPWVFATVAVGIAYLPGLVAPRLGGYVLLFCTLVTLLGAATGIAVVTEEAAAAAASSVRPWAWSSPASSWRHSPPPRRTRSSSSRRSSCSARPTGAARCAASPRCSASPDRDSSPASPPPTRRSRTWASPRRFRWRPSTTSCRRPSCCSVSPRSPRSRSW